MNNTEKLVRKAKALVENTPNGVITDCDTILCDIIECGDFEVTGIGKEIFDIWLKSSDRESVEQLFYAFTDVDFEEFVNLCIEKTTKS